MQQGRVHRKHPRHSPAVAFLPDDAPKLSGIASQTGFHAHSGRTQYTKDE
jgi:hypothetical protein